MIRRGAWVPRSTAFVVVEVSLGWISASYGLNLIFSDPYKRLVTPATLAAIESIGSLELFGYLLLAGSVLLATGIIGRWPIAAAVGHLVMAVVFVSIGVSVLQVAPLNQVFLVMGLVLHPTMAIALARDVGTAAGNRDLRK